jgi:hypothetical protein
MNVSETRIAPSPEGGGRIRYSATVEYGDRRGTPEEIWFEFEAKCADDLAPSGNPWLVALLPVAAHLGETLRIADPVDRLLLEGVHEDLRIWRSRDSQLVDFKIEAPIRSSASAESSGRVGSFFSGGADSFFSVLFHDSEPEYMTRVEELITVWGFDIPLSKPNEIETARASLEAAGRKIGRSHLFCWTNVRETRINDWDWNDWGCLPCLAAVALCLEKRYSRVLLPTGWGATSSEIGLTGLCTITTENFSTQRTRLKYDGAAFSRSRKLAFLAKSSIAMEHLRICWEGFSAHNCSACSKCIRTMIALAAVGALERCKTLDATKLTPDRIRRYRTRTEGDIVNFEMLLSTLPDTCPTNLRTALEECIENNKAYYNRLRTFEKLERTRLVGWLFGHYKRRFVLEPKKRT